MCKMSVTELLSKEDLIFCSHLKHPDKKSEGTYIHYDCCHLASLNGSKYTVQQMWQEVVVHPLTSFKILVQVLAFPFNNSSCFISSQLWLLLEAFLISPLYCLVQLFPVFFFTWYCPCFVLWLLHRHSSSLSLIWLLSGKSFLFSSPYHCAFQPPLPAQLGSGGGSSRWKTGIRHTYPYMVSLVWWSWCLSHPFCGLVSIWLYPGQLVKKENINPWHCKSD